MNIQQLEHIIEVVKSGSITEAAYNSHVTQAALSKSIHNLELELGIKIFTRSRVGTIPTEDGKKVIKKAFEIIQKVQELKEEVMLDFDQSYSIKISSSPTVFLATNPLSLSAFKEKYPNVKLSIQDRTIEGIFSDIRSGERDFGLIIYIPAVMEERLNEMEDLVYEPIVEGKLVVCVGKNNKLAFSQYLTIEEVLDEPFVLIEDADWIQFLNTCIDKEGKLEVAISSNDNLIAKKAISEGIGINLGFDFNQKYDPYMTSGKNIVIPLINCNDHHISFGYVYSKKYPLSNTASELLNFIKMKL
ncbi:LysR substrate-binding domain-containing protein [Gottfriedia sp. NPDC057991]|uniref:LysR family transcriptional regulator n=1 Tax=Gottfriedia sp. NPDC057991 TaxID=3346298 RepID=UPI0036DCD5BA